MPSSAVNRGELRLITCGGHDRKEGFAGSPVAFARPTGIR